MFFQKIHLANQTKNSIFFNNLGYAKNRSYRSHRSHTFYMTHMTHMTKFSYTVKKNLGLEHEKTDEFFLRLYDQSLVPSHEEKPLFLSDLNEVFC